MSKNIIYKCDCCGKQKYDEKPDWIEIGSRGENQLYVINKTDGEGLKELNHHSPVHFCSRYCLVRFFFGGEYAEQLKTKVVVN